MERVGLDMCLGPEFLLGLPAQGARTAGCIGDDMASTLQAVDQGGGLRAVAALTSCRGQPHRQSKGIDGGVEPAREASVRAPDSVSLSPLPPVASACALQIVLSMRAYSKSGTALNWLKRCSDTLAISQRRKRVSTRSA